MPPNGDDNGDDDDEQRGVSVAKKFAVISIGDYGRGHSFSDARDTRVMMAAATRIDDRSQEIPLNRGGGGDWAHRPFEYRVPLEGSEIKLEEKTERVVLEDGKTKTEKKYFLCNLLDTMEQTCRGPWHMMPKWRYEERVDWYLDLQRTRPDYPVPYPMVGFKDRRVDKAARRAIRLNQLAIGERGYDPDVPADKRLPAELRKPDPGEFDGEEDESKISYRPHLDYVTPIKNLDLRALTVLAHFDGFMENITAKQVWNNLLDTLRRHSDDSEIKGIDPDILAPNKWTDETADKWDVVYQLLREKMDYITDHYYDRWDPAEQYIWRKRLSEILREHNPRTPKGKAEAKEALMDLTIHVIRRPKIFLKRKKDHKVNDPVARVNEFEAKLRDAEEQKNSSEVTKKWKMQLEEAKADARYLRCLYRSSDFEEEVDWEPFRYFAEGIEAWRDWNRMVHHWQQTKSIKNKKAAGTLNDTDIGRARDNDHGGIWQAIPNERDSRFMSLYNWAEGLAPLSEIPLDEVVDQEEGETVAEWEQRTDQWRVDFQGRRMLLRDVRKHILGWAWFSEDPRMSMDHDGSLMAIFNDKSATWVEMIRKYVRAQSSNAGVGKFPTWEELLEKVLARVRNYEDEDDWSDTDVYAQRTPVDFWLHQQGIISFRQMSEANTRLAGIFRHAPQVQLTYDNCTRIRDFITLMWRNLPTGPILRRAAVTYEGARLAQVFHIWPEVQKKVLNGLSEEVTMAMADELDKMHIRSDKRARLKAGFKARGTNGTIRGWTFGDAGKLDDEGYGRRLNPAENVRKKIQQRLTRIYDLAWRCDQISRQIWFVRSVLSNPAAKADQGAIMDTCTAMMRNGLAREYAIAGLKKISDAGWLPGIKLDKLFDAEMTEAEKQLERHFDQEIVTKYVGEGVIGILERNAMFVALADEEEY